MSEPSKSPRRPVKAIDAGGQLALFSQPLSEPKDSLAQPPCEGSVRFQRPDPRRIFIGDKRLDEHLKAMQVTAPLRISRLLGQQDFTPFEQHYANVGRPPYAPEAMLGLILYGLIQGLSSLRELERLARVDLGAMWLTGGLCPDHASIGRFIQRHDAQITGPFVTELTGSILRQGKQGVETLAGDGTVVQAAASAYHTLRLEALQVAAQKAQERAQERPDDAKRGEQAIQMAQAEQRLQARAQARQAKGKDASGLSLNPVEPDAVVQRQKDGKRFLPSYKPSVLANAHRLIVGWGISASSESEPLATMFEQAAALGKVQHVLFDAGYCNATTLDACAERHWELLCPEGRAQGEDDWQRASNQPFHKNRFNYDPHTDTYICLNGERLHRLGKPGEVKPDQDYVRYGSTHCQGCPLRDQCTSSRSGRVIKRYRIDGAKEALREKMSDPSNRQKYRQRQAMVEPVFSALKQQQGLWRFRRRGLNAVRREFALHVMAYNLGRALVLGVMPPLYAHLWPWLRAMLPSQPPMPVRPLYYKW